MAPHPLPSLNGPCIPIDLLRRQQNTQESPLRFDLRKEIGFNDRTRLRLTINEQAERVETRMPEPEHMDTVRLYKRVG